MDDKSLVIRVPKRLGRIAMIAVAVALIVAPLTAAASHVFNDVPNTHTFHDDITWLADAGVTKGCNPPTNDQFCPDDNVTRGQMGAFMNRFAQYIGAEDGTPANADNADNADQLDGKNGTAYETRVAADGCKLSSTGDTTSCGPNSDGSVGDQTTIELGRVTLNAPSNGTIVIEGYRFGSMLLWFTLNQGCAAYGIDGSAIVAQLLNGVLFGAGDDLIENGSTAVAVASGNQTIRLCGVYTGTDGGGFIGSASVTAFWTAGGSATIAEASGSAGASGTLPSLDDLLGG